MIDLIFTFFLLFTGNRLQASTGGSNYHAQQQGQINSGRACRGDLRPVETLYSFSCFLKDIMEPFFCACTYRVLFILLTYSLMPKSVLLQS